MASNQRMAGDIWKTYDANSKGGSGFDDDDLNHLKGQSWSNNDIMRAAAKSGSVNSNTSSALSKLNNNAMSAKDLPSALRKKMTPGSAYDSYTFMGGDQNDLENYRRSNNIPQAKNQSIEDWISDTNHYAATVGHNKKVESRYGSEVLQWGGVNADGSANSLSGYKESYDPKNRKTPYKRENVSWALPSDVVESSRQADFDKRYSAKQPAQTTGGATEAKAPPRFDIRNYMTPERSSDSTTSTSPAGSGSTATASRGSSTFVADTKATAYEAYKARRENTFNSSSSSSSYSPTTVNRSTDSSGERDLNQRWRQFWDPNSSTAQAGSKAILS